MREGELAVRRQVLVPEHDHQILQQGRTDFGEYLVRQVLGQVHAGHLSAQGARDLARLDMAIGRIADHVHRIIPPGRGPGAACWHGDSNPPAWEDGAPQP